MLPFKLDSGAQVTLLSVNDYKALVVKSMIYPVKIKRNNKSTGESIPGKGSCADTIKHKGQRLRTRLLVVDKSVQLILG